MEARRLRREFGMVTIDAISKRFDDMPVLKNISLSIKKKSIVGLAGPSGSGKSTLLRCIQELEKQDAGTIMCNGKTGFMFQDFQLFPHMTVLGNLMYAPKIRAKGIDCMADAMDILGTLGIADKAHAYPCNLSGGQKQRVALARSLMMRPQILLCDEPTSGLDIATVLDVVSLLTSIRDLGMTMIIASHDLDFLTKIADRVVLLKNGTIVLDVVIQKLENPIQYLKNYY